MKTAPHPTTPSVRIEGSLLDSLMNLAGELVLCRNQLLQAIGGDDRRLLEITGQRIDLVTSEIQEQIMRTRMQPIGELLNRFPPVVAALSRESGKPVDLALSGKNVDIEKTVMEALEAPLNRLIENAVQHGIETPEIRQRLGKPAKGTIAISAFHEAGQVGIEYEEDEATPDSAALTGLDDIRVGLEKVGGTVHVNPKKDHGKQVRIKLPLIALHEAIAVDPLPESDHCQVVCFTIDGRGMGLLAAPPVDAAEVAFTLGDKTLKQPVVLGSAVLNDRTTMFLDIEQVVKNTKPELFDED